MYSSSPVCLIVNSMEIVGSETVCSSGIGGKSAIQNILHGIFKIFLYYLFFRLKFELLCSISYIMARKLKAYGHLVGTIVKSFLIQLKFIQEGATKDNKAAKPLSRIIHASIPVNLLLLPQHF